MYVLDPINSADFSGNWGFLAVLAAPIIAPVVITAAIVTTAVVVVAVAGYAVGSYIASRSTPSSSDAKTGTGGAKNGGGPSNASRPSNTPRGGGGGGGGSAAPRPPAPKPPQPPKRPSVEDIARKIKEAMPSYKPSQAPNSIKIRVPEGQFRYDIAGKAHYNKKTGETIPTPHKVFRPNEPRNPNDGLGKKTQPVPMEWDDVYTVIKYLTGQ